MTEYDHIKAYHKYKQYPRGELDILLCDIIDELGSFHGNSTLVDEIRKLRTRYMKVLTQPYDLIVDIIEFKR